MFKEKIRNKEKMVSMYQWLGDVSLSRITALAGYDALWLDSEHSYVSYETLLSQILAIRTTDTAVVVRAPQNDLTATKKILELGVDGIIFPMIRTPKEARDAVNAVKYPPYGERGFGPMNAINYGYTPLDEYLEGAKDVMVFVQIEHKDAIDCLDELMEIDGIDGFVFGPNDLAGSYGLMGKVFSDKVSEVIKDAVRRLHERDKYVVIASGGFSEEIISHWAGFGADMIFAGADFDFVREGAISNRKNIERILGIS